MCPRDGPWPWCPGQQIRLAPLALPPCRPLTAAWVWLVGALPPPAPLRLALPPLPPLPLPLLALCCGWCGPVRARAPPAAHTAARGGGKVRDSKWVTACASGARTGPCQGPCPGPCRGPCRQALRDGESTGKERHRRRCRRACAPMHHTGWKHHAPHMLGAEQHAVCTQATHRRPSPCGAGSARL